MSPIGMGATSSACSRAGMPLPSVTILNLTSLDDMNSRRLSSKIGGVEANNKKYLEVCTIRAVAADDGPDKGSQKYHDLARMRGAKNTKTSLRCFSTGPVNVIQQAATVVSEGQALCGTRTLWTPML